MAIIDPEGLFGGDRIRRCSNTAQLHWPRLFLASDGFGRIEINYARIVGRAYSTFNPIPVAGELLGWIHEYARNSLMFLYEAAGQRWGQWDTRSDLLPRYKTAADRRSPIPPEPAFTEWKNLYRAGINTFPKSLGNVSEDFLYGVGVGGGGGIGVGDGKNICASGDARLSALVPTPSVDDPPFDSLDPQLLFSNTESEGTPADPLKERCRLAARQDTWFREWWGVYWRKESRKPAWEKFKRLVLTEERFQEVMKATRTQTPVMLSKELCYRPLGSTWLFQERWTDQASEVTRQETQGERIARKIREGRG